MNTLKLEEKACNFETFRHIERVRNLLQTFIKELLDRGEQHDQSKLESPEVEYFTKLTDKLAVTKFNSQEDKDNKKELEPALNHHYAKNRHHPQHFKNGIEDMNLVDIVEMFFDWKASSERSYSGNILKSIETNADRFNIAPQLIKIFENTAESFEGK